MLLHNCRALMRAALRRSSRRSGRSRGDGRLCESPRYSLDQQIATWILDDVVADAFVWPGCDHPVLGHDASQVTNTLLNQPPNVGFPDQPEEVAPTLRPLWTLDCQQHPPPCRTVRQ